MPRKKNALWRLIALMLAAVMVLAACGSDDDDDDDAGSGDDGASGRNERGNLDDVLTIGRVLPETGDLALLGPPMIKAVELAIQQINEAGGVLDKDVVLVAGNSGTNEDVASETVNRQLSSEKVDAIVGPASSRVTKAVIDEITGAGVVECSPSNTGDELTTIDDNGGFYFRTAPPDILQSQALAEVIANDDHEKVAILALNDAYGKGFAENLEGDLKDAGVEVTANVAYDPKGASFDADVKKVVDTKPDAVALISFPDTGGRILTTMIEQGAGPDKVGIYVADGMQSNDLFGKVDPNNPAVVKGIRGTAPSAAPKAGRPGFGEEFAAFAPGTDTIFSAHAYDCVMVIALAAVAAESDDPGKIQKEMNAVTKGGEKCTSFADCKKLLEDGEDIDYDGASGPLDFVDAGEPGAGTYDVYEFGADGKYVTEPDQIDIG